MKSKITRIPAVLVSLVLLVSLMIPMSVSAAAAGTGAALTSAADYSISDATSFVFSDTGIEVTEGAYSGYQVKDTALTIKESGTYVVSGKCENGTIVIKKNVTGVTLVLNALDLSASATAPITCNKGSEVTIVAAAGSVNNLADDEYNNDDIYSDETLYPDIENAVIKCKDGSNVTICGTGMINITANGKNGVKGGYDLYEEDEDGNVTDTLLSTASLTIKDVTLNIVANVNDGLKSDKVLNILSGTITISAADDGIKCDYTMNIGAEGADGPTIAVKNAAEGIEAATLNVYSGSIAVNASDDGINAANSDLTNYSFSYNQYDGYVYVNVTGGDGIDSNGTINLVGGTLEVYTPSQGDGDPLDSERGVSFNGATVLAVGHLGMAQGYSAAIPYVTFGSSGEMPGGFDGMNGNQSNLVTAGSTIQITDASGNVLYSAKAVRNASYILFASPDLSSGSTYTLKNGTTAAATATASTAASGGMGGPGNQVGNTPGQPPEGMGPGGQQGQDPNQQSGSTPPAEPGQQPPENPENAIPEPQGNAPGVAEYDDVNPGDWFYPAVQFVSERGIMVGTGASFEPDAAASRAMLVTILYRLEGEPAVSSANPFSDAADDQWYTDAVIWASENGIVSGYGNGFFGPTDPVTREQFAVILYRYAQYKGYDTGAEADISGYTDASSVSSWAKTAMKWACAEGLISGRTATELVPSGNAMRAEAAAILMRFIESV